MINDASKLHFERYFRNDRKWKIGLPVEPRSSRPLAQAKDGFLVAEKPARLGVRPKGMK